MINPKQIFTWWHKQTFGTFLKTLFFGKFVGADSCGNKYYKSKNNQRWVVYKDNIEASKITSEWFLWMHHTIDEIPNKKKKKNIKKKKKKNLFKIKILKKKKTVDINTLFNKATKL